MKHFSLQSHSGRSVSPIGVIISALAECEGQDVDILQKAIHIDNALAFFVHAGYKIKYHNDGDSLLIFERSTKQE